MTQAEWRQMVDQAEHYLVAAIKTHLRTPVQKLWMDAEDISIEDILNGRWTFTPQRELIIHGMFAEWNRKLGWKEFGT